MGDESESLLLNLTTAPDTSGVHRSKKTPQERRAKFEVKQAKKQEKLRAKRRKKQKNKKGRQARASAGGEKGSTANTQPSGNVDGKKSAQIVMVPPALSKPNPNLPKYLLKPKTVALSGSADGKTPAKALMVASVLGKPNPNIPKYVSERGTITPSGNTEGKKPAPPPKIPSVLRKPKPNLPAFVSKPKRKTVKFNLEDSGKSEKSGDSERTTPASTGKFVVKGRDESKVKGTQGVLPPSTPAAEGGEFASFVKRKDKGRVGVPLRVKQRDGTVTTFTPKVKATRGFLPKFQETKIAREEEPDGLKEATTTISEGSQPQVSEVEETRPKRGWAEANKDSGYEEEASEEELRPRKQKGAAAAGEARPRGRHTSLFGNNPEIPVVAQRAVKPLEEKVFADQQFSELAIHAYQVSNLRSLGLTRLTEVQRRAVPALLAGRDALVRSQTGSGKTLAYALPLVELLQRQRPALTRADGVRAVVVLPTRELALQTYEVFGKLVKPFMRLVPGILAGGEKRKAEKARLRKGISILVGTPGRLLDHVNNTRSLRLDKVQFLVLDEADRLLDMGYEKDVSSLVAAIDTQSAPLLPDSVLAWNRSKAKKFEDEGDGKEAVRLNKIIKFNSDSEDEEGQTEKKGKITKFTDGSDDEDEREDNGIAECEGGDEHQEAADGEKEQKDEKRNNNKKKTRQTVLLSATLTPGVERLAGLALHSHVYIDAADADATAAEVVIPSGLQQYYMMVPAKLRLVTLSAFIVAKCKGSQQRKMLLFCGTQDMVDYLSALLSAGLGRGSDLDGIKRTAGGSDSEGDGSDGEMDAALLAAAAAADDDDGPAVDVEFFRLHGSMDQKERTHVFQTFREAKSGVLLCTDVAARGLDLPRVDWIVQWTAPCSVADYVHRVGRTARGGAQGHALLFLCPHEAPFLAMLQERRIRLQEEKLERCLIKLAQTQGTTSSEAAATHLQSRFENAVLEHRNLRELAVKAYVSFVRFYATYPRDVREAFSFKALHLGHFAKSFALRDPPSAIAALGRRQHERDQKRQRPRKGPAAAGKSGAGAPEGVRPKGMHGAVERARNAKARVRTRDLVLSEFSSGLQPAKKRKKLG